MTVAIEYFSIVSALSKEHFYGKILQKMCDQELTQHPLLILINNPKQPLHVNIVKEDCQKAFKSLTLFFLSNPVLFNG